MFSIADDMDAFGLSQYYHTVRSESWTANRLPLTSVMLEVNNGYYYVGFNALAINMIRHGASVVGLAGIIHASMDNSTYINVPFPVKVDWVMGDRHTVFMTKSMPNNFIDPSLPYLSVKRIIAPDMARFIEDAINA